MSGFIGPKDIFRNPEAIFRFFEPTSGVAADKNLIDITLANKVCCNNLCLFSFSRESPVLFILASSAM